ncbi:MAG: hypothetical protein NW216_13335 [Hyphomicrobium sp.]|nr:hypothetical protein [Hyphomicrobium sp.]
MWSLLGSARRLTLALTIAGAAIASALPAAAQYGNGYPYNYSNHTYSYGLNLPQVPMPNGQDEIRAADGTSCRSSMASNAAYLDLGAFGSQGYNGDVEGGTFYGRVIMPLGETPKRLDCAKLYELEILRLKHELDLVRSGGGAVGGEADFAAPMKSGTGGDSALVIQGPPAAGAKSQSSAKKSDWAESGWSNSGWKTPQKAGAGHAAAVAPPAEAAPQRPAAAETERPVPQPETALNWETRVAYEVYRPGDVDAASTASATARRAEEQPNFFSHLGGGF